MCGLSSYMLVHLATLEPPRLVRSHPLSHFLAAFVVIVQRGYTPLHVAAEKGDAACVELLLEHKSDVAATNQVCDEY